MLLRLALFPILLDGWAAEDYWLAEQIVAGNGFQAQSLYGDEVRPTSQKAPGAPYLLALSMWLAPAAERAWFLIFQSVAAGLGCYWAGRLAARTLGPREGLLTAALLAAFVPHIWWMRHIGQHIFAASAMSGTLLLCYRLHAKRSFAAAAAWGLGLGVAAYFSVDVLLPAPFLALWLAIRLRDRGLMLALGLPLVAASTAFATIAPWTVRNYLVHERFVLVRTGLGTALYWGNNPRATGTDWVVVEEPDGTRRYSSGRHEFDPELLAELAPLSEVEQESLLQDRAIAWIRQHPWEAGELLRRKAGYYWWFTRMGDLDPVPWVRDFAWSGVLAMMLLGLIAALGATPDPGFLLPLLVPFATSTAVHVTTVVSANWRMRIPIEPLILLFAAHGLLAVAWIIRRGGSRPGRREARAATAPRSPAG